MKIILGDNQFFGINHSSLSKADKAKIKFSSVDSIVDFINKASNNLDGFMMNSNEKGFKVVNKISSDYSKEIHYSIPYPHKYAAIVNESGMIGILSTIMKLISFRTIFSGIKFMLTRNIKFLIPILVKLELPNNLEKGNYIYLQNIVTDLCLGLGLDDYLLTYVNTVKSFGYKPGLITLNPILLDKKISKWNEKTLIDLCVCFNINLSGFNVFPNQSDVIKFCKQEKSYKRMGMSIFSSGALYNESVFDFIKSLNLNYIVFGSSKLQRIKSNCLKFKNKF